MIGVGLSIPQIAGSSTAFSPLTLFAAGEQGVWFDPSDFSTMFQDSGGTTPVTAVEQPVGLILDKSGRGNHASQSTAASRPVLSARVNALIRSQEFDNAAWSRISVTSVTANNAVSWDGTMTADTIAFGVNGVLYQNATLLSGVTYTLGAWVRSVSGTADFRFTYYNGTTSLYSAVQTATTTWQFFSASFVGSGAAGNVGITTAVGGSTTIIAGGADLRPTNAGVNLPAYQRVGASTDYDTTGFSYYLKFDGVDDSLATGTINPGSVDKVSLFAGLRKSSNAAAGVVAETSTAPNTTNGTFALLAPTGASTSIGFYSRGTTQQGIGVTGYTSPLSMVITGVGDISGDVTTTRANGVVASNATADQGTGNYLSYPLYIGRRGGVQFPFNGNLYSLIVRFSAANLDAGAIAKAETWVNGKTGAY